MAEELAAKLAKGGSELRFLLVHHKVSDDIQAELFSNGIELNSPPQLRMRRTSRKC